MFKSSVNILYNDNYGARREINRLCHYIEGHLQDKINLPMMEKISGLSARSLQYGFRKYFGCSHCKWLQNKRLYAANNKLNNPNNSFNITTIVYDFGFLNNSSFSKYYKIKFGEKPSITLARNKQRVSLINKSKFIIY